MDIQSSPLSIRAINALTNAGYKTVEQCQSLSESKLYSIKNVGKKTVLEIRQFCKSFNNGNQGVINEIKKARRADDAEASRDYYRMVLPISLSQILFSVRVKNCLDKLKVKSIKDLVQISEQKILDQKNAGKKSVKDILFFLSQLDLKLDMNFSAKILKEIDETLKSEKDPAHLLDEFKKLYPAKAMALDQQREQVIGIKRIEFYKKCFDLYKQQGTLERVAKILKLTRERIRQILVKGTKLGLFKYSGIEYPFVAKEKILSDYETDPSLHAVAKNNHIPITYLHKLLTAYEISESNLIEVKNRSKMKACIQEYRAIESELGYSPTTTEMQKRSDWRSLHARIGRSWGTIDAFRRELNIPAPVRTLPEVSRQAFEKRKRLAFIVRMQNLDQIRECLSSSGPLSTLEISYECGMKPPKAYRLLGMLMATKEIIREGEGNATKYRIKIN